MLRQPLACGVGLWLAIKVAALTAIFLLFFGPNAGQERTADGAGHAFIEPVYQDPVRIEFDY